MKTCPWSLIPDEAREWLGRLGEGLRGRWAQAFGEGG